MSQILYHFGNHLPQISVLIDAFEPLLEETSLVVVEKMKGEEFLVIWKVLDVQ